MKSDQDTRSVTQNLRSRHKQDPPSGVPTSEAEAEELSSLLSSVYDAAIDQSLWVNSLKKACGFLECSAGVVLGSDILGNFNIAVQWGYQPSFWDSYRNQYFHLDPLNSTCFRSRIGDVVMGHELAAWQGMFTTPFYREWVEPQGFVDLVSGTLDKWASGVAMITCIRHGSVGPADAETARRMRLIVPHFRRAVQIAKMLDVKDIRVSAFVEAIDALSANVFFVNREGNLLHANATGRDVLLAEDPLFLANGALSASDAAAHRALRRALTAADFQRMTTSLPIRGRHGRQFAAHVLPLTSGARRQVGVDGSAVSAVFLRETSIDIPLAIQAAASLYGFTPAEERVLEGVIELGGLSRIADQLGVARRTVQTHLEHLFEKTGCRRQADLVKLIAGHQSPVRS